MRQKSSGCATKRRRRSRSEARRTQGGSGRFARLSDIARRIGRAPSSVRVEPSTDLTRLGLGSLDRVELVAEVEHAFQVRLPEDLAFDIRNLGELLRAIEGAPAKDTVGTVSASFRRKLFQPSGETEAGHDLPRRGCLSRVIAAVICFGSRALWRLDAHGCENLPGESQGPFVLCANHTSHLDVFWVLAALPRSLRSRVVALGKQEHFARWSTRIVANAACVIPVDREGSFLSALRAAGAALKGDRLLFLHPEGTRSADGALGPLREGVALIVEQYGTPVVPVHIDGGFTVFPRHRLLPRLFDRRRLRRFRVQVRFGPAILPEHVASGEQHRRRYMSVLKERLLALSGSREG